jgi:hypothetical protein
MADSPKKDWLAEFNEFSNLNASEHQVPSELFEKIKRQIFPNPWVVFSKILILHFIVGGLSLVICNQFGLNPFQTDQSLTRWFMKVGGHHFCMVGCGLFFMATTYFLSNLFITLEELESVRRHEWLQMALVGLLSLTAFYFFGADLIAMFVLLWLLGAMVGGFLSIEASYRLRRSWV